MKPKAIILRGTGTNCDIETFNSFKYVGAEPELVHINQLLSGEKKVLDYSIMAFPGGFSYGDDIAGGKVLAIELTSFLKKEIQNFIKRKGIVLGICNGFQTLVRTGLLPFNKFGKMDVTLTTNDSGKFECRWVKIKSEKSPSKFINDFDRSIEVAVNHGEGKFYTNRKTLKKIEDQNLVIYRYVDNRNNFTQKYPENPNGSMNAIAGICDSTGRIVGLMPHPEKFVDKWQKYYRPNIEKGCHSKV